jgi:hypothetical protein
MRARTVSINHDNSYQAGRQAALELVEELAAPDLVMMFANSRHDAQGVLDGVWSVLSEPTRLIGCSSYAEIGAEDAAIGSVTLMGIEFGKVEWQLFSLDAIGESSTDAGRRFAMQMQDFGPRLVVMLPDLVANSIQLVRAMREVLGPDCPIIGGVASEQLEFVRTWEFLDRKVIGGGIVALALRGPLRVVTVARAGFQPVGAMRTCTRVEDGKLILELDGRRALDIYKELLGPDVAARPNIGIEFPLAVIQRSPSGDYMGSDERAQVIRVVRQLDEERGALLCAGDIEEGVKVRMTRGNKEDLIAAAKLAIEQGVAAMPDAQLAFLFNCAGRKLVLGARYREEINAAFGPLGDIPRIGFYTYGELAPVDGTNMYHDETFTLALVASE